MEHNRPVQALHGITIVPKKASMNELKKNKNKKEHLLR